MVAVFGDAVDCLVVATWVPKHHAAFDSTNEVLSSAVETVTLINSHTTPLSWEITKCDPTRGYDCNTDRSLRYHPALESWDSSTLRFELQGPRKGVLQPRASPLLMYHSDTEHCDARPLTESDLPLSHNSYALPQWRA